MNQFHSLRARLLLAGAIGTLMIVASSVWLMGKIHDDASRLRFDQRIEAELAQLAGMAEIALDGRLILQRQPIDDRYTNPLSGQYWQIQDGDRQLRSRSLWDTQLTSHKSTDTKKAQFRDMTGPRGEPLRMVARSIRLPKAGRAIHFMVAADRSELIEEAQSFRWWVAVVATSASLVLLILAWTQMRFVLRPLRHLSQSVSAIRNGGASRIPEDDLPKEIAPLGKHLNELLAQHERALAQARAATQDLAHALKTPLSVLAIEAHHLPAASGSAIREQLTRIEQIVGRQLQGAVAADPQGRTRLMPTVAALLDVMRKIHRARDIRFTMDVPDDAIFAGHAADLEEMIGNLLDNAGKWAKQSVELRARIAPSDRVLIDIRDDGPGLTTTQIEQAMQRGIRLDERVPGSGFGLDIVRQIAEGYGGKLDLQNAGPGLLAQLELPGAVSHQGMG